MFLITGVSNKLIVNYMQFLGKDKGIKNQFLITGISL